MNLKPFELGIIVGRFQTFHTGHEYVVNTAAAVCRRTAIFVGSSQESGTLKNPFDYETRERVLKKLFGSTVEVYPLPDIGVGTNCAWGNYVLENVREHCGRLPDLLVSGKEERRLSWFDGTQGANAAELYVPKTIDISATKMREFFIDDNFEEWKRYTNPVLWDEYEPLRERVLASRDNLNTSSI